MAPRVQRLFMDGERHEIPSPHVNVIDESRGEAKKRMRLFLVPSPHMGGTKSRGSARALMGVLENSYHLS